MKQTVLETIVQEGMCCGCGTCAGVCPSGCLRMDFNRWGEYQPYRDGECWGCGLCLRVCPFFDNIKDEIADEIFSSRNTLRKGEFIGYYHSCLMGYAKVDGLREKGSSGGMATLLLSYMIRKGDIDGAVIVDSSARDGVFFESKVARSVDEIYQGAKSKYYPIEHSRALLHIRRQEGKYALVGLPCHIYGLRKAQKYDRVLRERIRFTFGLVCGHNVSSNFTKYLIDCTGLQIEEIQNIEYRDKFLSQLANNYSFAVTAGSDKGGTVRLPFQETVFGAAWQRRMFQPKACEYCDDVFAELADATFMDAWLEQQIKDPAGHSIVVCRNSAVRTLLNEAQEKGECNLVEVDGKDISNSQKSQIQYKCLEISKRIRLLEQKTPRNFMMRKEGQGEGSPGDGLRVKIVRWNRWVSRRAYGHYITRKIIGPNLVDLCPPVHMSKIRPLLGFFMRFPALFLRQKLCGLLGLRLTPKG